MEIASQPVEVVVGKTSITIYKFRKGTQLLTYLLLSDEDLPDEGLVSSSISEDDFEKMEELLVMWNTYGY